MMAYFPDPTYHLSRAGPRPRSSSPSGLACPFATPNRWEGGVTTPQGMARTAIAPLAAEEFGDSTR